MRSLLIVARDGSGGQWDPVARLMCGSGALLGCPKTSASQSARSLNQ